MSIQKDTDEPDFDVLVVGGGPAGATAAHTLALQGYAVALLERGGRIKPCGGAIPPRLIRDFAIPTHLLVARIRCARMVSPKGRRVDIPIEDGYVGMVDRGVFDAWLRQRAGAAGARLLQGTFIGMSRLAGGSTVVEFSRHTDSVIQSIRVRCVIGADGARSAVARASIPEHRFARWVFAYHEIVRAPAAQVASYHAERCDVVYDGVVSPDFYGWVFPHGSCVSVGSGSADKGFSLRKSVQHLRAVSGLSEVETLRREGAPIPLKPLPVWDNQKDVVLAGDAAGVVAPASGEGIYYAMLSGQFAAEAVAGFLRTGHPRELARARQRFMRAHGRVFWILSAMQYFWYRNDRRRERFVSVCRDPDVQKLTFDAYMNKELVRAKPLAHVRIFFKDLAHLTGLLQP